MKVDQAARLKALRKAQAKANQDRLKRPMMLQIEQAGLPGPRTEFKFHPDRNWRFDACWPLQMIALELEGGTWMSGRHTRGAGYRSDCEKYSEAAILGWTVIRATTDMVRDGTAIKLVKRAFGLDS